MSVPSTRPAPKQLWPVGIGWLFLCLAVLFQILCLTRSLDFLIDVIFDRDDAFYYFVIARNMVETGRASFDGVHLSNGVQFLWHYMLVGLAYLVPEKITFLRSVLVISLMFNVLAGVLIWELGRRLRSLMLADIALILWAGIMVERWDTFQGMEFSLHIVVILAVLLVLWEIWNDPKIKPLRFTLLGLLLTLNFWTRLDAVVFSIAIWAFAVFLLWHRRAPVRHGLAGLFGMTAIPALGALLYIWTSYVMAETLLPISGGVKSDYARAYFEDVGTGRMLIEQAGWWLKIQSHMLLALVPDTIYHLSIVFGFNPMSELAHLILPLTALGLVAIGLIAGWRALGTGSPYAPIFLGGVALWIISAAHVALMVYALNDFSHVTRHYYGWLLIFWLIWGAVLLNAVTEILPRLVQAGIIVVFISGALLSYGSIGVRFLSNYQIDEENYSVIIKELASDLSSDLPQDAVVGSWNAGRLSYFLDRPVINLDGLVNDEEFREMLQAKTPLQTYFQETGITHLVDHQGPDLTWSYNETRTYHNKGHNAQFFRNGITWAEVDVLKQADGIYVLELKE